MSSIPAVERRRGADYTFAGETLTFPIGASTGNTQLATVFITNDTAVDPAETVILGLESVTGPSAIGTGNTTHTITIIDDESRNFVITPTGGGTQVVGERGTPTPSRST